MVRWVVGSIPHGGPIKLLLVSASAPLLDAECAILSGDGAFKRTLAANRKK